MKKLQIPLEDELMYAAKLYALENSTTLREIVTLALRNAINYRPKTAKPEPAPKKEQKQTNKMPELERTPEPIQPKKSKPKYSKTYSFTIPETAKIGEPEKETKQYGVYPLTWLLSEGQRAHYDKDGALIPYRHTDEDGNIIEPDEYDMDQIQAEHDRIKEEKRRKEEEEDNSPW